MQKVLSWFCGDTVGAALMQQCDEGLAGRLNTAFVVACVTLAMTRGVMDIFSFIKGVL